MKNNKWNAIAIGAGLAAMLAADSVKAYLVDKGGVDAGKIEAEGRGKADPVTKPDECGAKRSSATIACLQPDRRVEIEVSGTQR